MSDDQFAALIARLDGLAADVQLQFAIVNGEIRDTRRTVSATGDEMRQRIATAEATFVNEIRALGARLDRMDERLTRLETA